MAGSWSRTAALGGAVALLLGAAAPITSAHVAPAHRTAAAHGTIVDGLFEEPDTLNPAQGPGEVFSDIVETSMFRNLYEFTPTKQMVPELAASIPTIANGGISKNGLIYTFHLKAGLKWSNGTPVTSKDVWETWKVITSPGFVAASTVGWSAVKDVKIVNPLEFQVILDHPFAPLIDDIFAGNDPGIIPYQVFHGLSGKAAQNATYNHAPTVTDGPYKFVQWVPGASITVTANPYWWGPKPKTQKIVFDIIPSQNTLLADAQAHSINVYYFAPIEQAKPLSEISGVKMFYTTQPAWEASYFNFRDPQLRSLKVREALTMAIDRQALIQDVWDGKAIPLAADQPPDSWAYNPSLKPLPYDPTKAKQLLEQAGYKMNSKGYFEKDGKVLSIVYSTTADNAYRQASERLIQYWFKQIGVQMTLYNVPSNTFFGSLLPSGQRWDIGEYEDIEGVDPADAIETIFQTGGVGNYGNFSNSEVDRLLTSQNTMLTDAQRKPVLQHVEAILAQQLPAIFLYSPQGIEASVNMNGYQPDPWAEDTWNCYDWSLTK